MTEYNLGDLIVIVLENNYHKNQEMGIFKSYDSEKDEVSIYPLTKEGLSLAKEDNEETQEFLHRVTPYLITNYSKANTFIIDNPALSLDTLQKYYYDQIISRI